MVLPNILIELNNAETVSAFVWVLIFIWNGGIWIANISPHDRAEPGKNNPYPTKYSDKHRQKNAFVCILKRCRVVVSWQKEDSDHALWIF